MDKDALSSFIDSYKIKDGKQYESIISYISFDQYKINKDKENIINFLLNEFNITTDFDVLYIGYLMDHLKVENFEDVLLLNDLVGIFLASGLIVDNYIVRWNQYLEMDRENLKYLLIDEFDLTSYKIVKDYVHNFKIVAQELYYMTDENVLKKYQNNNEDNDIKQILEYWFTKTSKFPVTEGSLNKFHYLLEHNLTEMIDYCAYIDLKESCSTTAVMQLTFSDDLNIYDFVYQDLSHYTQDALEKFNEYKNMFIDNYNQIIKTQNKIDQTKKKN